MEASNISSALANDLERGEAVSSTHYYEKKDPSSPTISDGTTLRSSVRNPLRREPSVQSCLPKPTPDMNSDPYTTILESKMGKSRRRFARRQAEIENDYQET